ncbi:MAG: VIT domain-containing protein [Planctomycetaceae bacterium]|nr:VIT and VWA domain-containing protein [Planctomycetaceae bacterium]
MNTHLRAVAAAVVAMAVSTAALADGMIIPIRPHIQIRGSWSVKYHHVDIKVRDQVAMVSIDQAFENTGPGVLEVEYVFPVPPDAAIDSMTLMVDGKEYAAKLYKADEARRIYEDIVRTKKDPALLEYVGFGLYKTSAFPLQPGKPCRVLVNYKNVCHKDRDLVEVWYPLNTEKFSAKKISSVKVSVDIESRSDITSVYSPTHDLNVKRNDPRHVVATFEVKDALPATDFQVFYKAADEKVAATLLTSQPQPKEDGYFLMLVSPNPRDSQTNVMPKDIVLALDRSGSMNGEKIKQAKAAAAQVLNSLNKEDQFNVVVYSDSVEAFFGNELVAADKAHVERALETLDRIDAGGGTNIHEAMMLSLKAIKGSPSSRPKYVIFMTDGLPTVGETDEGKILKEIAAANKDVSARVFAMGVGYDVNVRLLDKLVGQNDGRSDYCKPQEPMEPKISSLYNKIKNPVMTDLSAEFGKLKVRDLYPRKLGDLFEGDQIVLVGRYDADSVKDLPAGAGGTFQTQLVVRGNYLGKSKTFEYPVSVCAPGPDLRYGFVEKLWAVRRVGYLLDQIQLHGKNQEVIDELVKLSLKYGIITPYTSFLADERTALHDAPSVRASANESLERYKDVSGAHAQVAAKARQSLNSADAPAPAAEAPEYSASGAGKSAGNASVYGNTTVRAYEADKKEKADSVRSVDNQTLYRRGNVWVADSAAKVDMEKDRDKIQTIHRYSDEYFKLIHGNTVEQNRLMASQRADEELLVTLRGQTYNIK